MISKPKSVLMFFPTGGSHSSDAFAGVRDNVVARNWGFFSADTVRGEDGSVRLHRSSRSAQTVSALVELLHPSGIVVWEDALLPAEVRAVAGPAVPVVFVDCGEAASGAEGGLFGVVRSDPASVAAVAARALLPSGYADFAFVPSPAEVPWSVERGDAFGRCIEIAGKRFHRFCRPDEPGADALVGWLADLPKPCGILAANDAVGEEVLGACAQLGIAVPDDIAVIGVDDYAYFCEATTPTLSSVAMNLRGEGRAAVELLALLMDSPGRAPPPPRFVPARGAVPRASTRFARDRRVARALEFIRVHACEEKFGPRDVVRAMDMSRAMADKLFRSVAGSSILDENHAVRLARACELLAAGKPGDIVATECGYSSHDDFRRVFRTRMGTTALRWAREHVS